MQVREVDIHGDKSRLVSIAESIGSTLGLIAAKVYEVHQITPDSRLASKRRGSKLAPSAKKSGSNITQASSPASSPRKAKKARRANIRTAGRRARSTVAKSSSKQDRN